jgi:hypothetical protein
MARPKKNIPVDVTDKLNANERSSKSKIDVGVPLPGGKRLSLDSFIGHDFRPERRESVFTAALKYIRNPNSSSKYVWKNCREGHNHELMQGLRMGYYKPITVDDMIDEIDVPIGQVKLPSNDDSAGFVQAVRLRDLVLVEVTKEKVDRQYTAREYEAAARTVPSAVRAKFEGELGNLANGLVSVEAEERDVDLSKF